MTPLQATTAPAAAATATARVDLPALADALRLDGWTPLALERRGPRWRPAGLPAADAAAALQRAQAYDGLVGVRGAGAVGATWLVEKEAWSAAVVAAGGLLTLGAAPALDRLWVQEGEDAMVVAVAAPEDGWQPSSGAELAAALVGLLAPAVGALGGARSTRALWRSVGDRLGQAVLWAGEATGDRDAATALLAEALAAPTLLQAPLRVEQLVDRGPLSRWRTGCCLANRVPALGRCADCSVRPKPA